MSYFEILKLTIIVLQQKMIVTSHVAFKYINREIMCKWKKHAVYKDVCYW